MSLVFDRRFQKNHKCFHKFYEMKWLHKTFFFSVGHFYGQIFLRRTQKSQMCIHIFYEMKSLHKNLLFQCVGTHCRHFMVTICFFLLPGVSSDTTNIQNSVAQKLSFGWRILLYLKLKANIFNNFSSSCSPRSILEEMYFPNWL